MPPTMMTLAHPSKTKRGIRSKRERLLPVEARGRGLSSRQARPLGLATRSKRLIRAKQSKKTQRTKRTSSTAMEMKTSIRMVTTTVKKSQTAGTRYRIS